METVKDKLPMNTDNNGSKPAYPLHEKVQGGEHEKYLIESGRGMTKREAFAMAAMQGILSNPNWKFSEGWAAGPALAEADELLKSLTTAPDDKSESDKLTKAIEHLKFLNGELKEGFKEGGETSKYLSNGIEKLLKQLSQ